MMNIEKEETGAGEQRNPISDSGFPIMGSIRQVINGQESEYGRSDRSSKD